MRILLAGNGLQNNGPSNVNKEIIKYKPGNLLYVKSSNRYLKYLEGIAKLICAQVLVVSGISRMGFFLTKVSRLLGKKVVFIMHGSAEYEAKMEGTLGAEKSIYWESRIINMADRVLPVSEKYSLWVKKQYPQYAEKVRYWHLGVNQHGICQNEKREAGSVAAAGGDRKLKNNLTVSNAIERLDGRAKLRVYGSVNGAPPCENKHTEWVGELPHEDFINELKNAGVFVVNSTIESFNMSVMEALSCGCSILVSDQVGAAGLLDLQETDIIYDTENEEEISKKIMFLINNPNNQRLCAAIDWEEISWQKAVRRLEGICTELVSQGKTLEKSE